MAKVCKADWQAEFRESRIPDFTKHLHLLRLDVSCNEKGIEVMADETTPKAPDTETPAPEVEQPSETPVAEAATEEKAAKKAAKPPKDPVAAKEGAEKAAAKPKKEKPPALEDKPFPEFISQHFMPALKTMLEKQGIADLDLAFEKRPYPMRGVDEVECWQVIGHWDGGERQFIIGFSKEEIAAPKFFCAADRGSTPSILESFMIDERKVTLDLLLLYAVQRLNGQKWLVRN